MEKFRTYAFPFLKNVFPRNRSSPDPYLKMRKCLNQDSLNIENVPNSDKGCPY